MSIPKIPGGFFGQLPCVGFLGWQSWLESGFFFGLAKGNFYAYILKLQSREIKYREMNETGRKIHGLGTLNWSQ